MGAADAGIFAVLAPQQVPDLGRHGFRSRTRHGVVIGLVDIEVGIDQQDIGCDAAEYLVVDTAAYPNVTTLTNNTAGQENTRHCQHRHTDYPR